MKDLAFYFLASGMLLWVMGTVFIRQPKRQVAVTAKSRQRRIMALHLRHHNRNHGN